MIVLLSVMFDGVSILSLLIGDPTSMKNALPQDLCPAGHAHAGVWLIPALVPLRYETELVREATDKLYAELTAAGFEVLLDDRDKKTSPGIKFADMELIGIPHRIVVSDRGLAEGNLEYKSRTEDAAQALPVDEVLSFIQARVRR